MQSLRKLIWTLAKNDFKNKFAGSYLGITWAFVQPVVTVLVYWFVFEKALNGASSVTKAGITVPFVLWLIAGLVPWFFFNDAMVSGTNALIEYNYLVKKVVFRIDILPIVKIISAGFVHLFFVAFSLFLYLCYGFAPTLYWLQIIYYSACVVLLVIGFTYITSALVVFFRDLSQIVSIVLQIGVWMTPIMWNMDALTLPGWISFILKLNPMYYVVTGYRNALINQVWFWETPGLTVYFWIVVLSLLAIGRVVFQRLKVHFADVL